MMSQIAKSLALETRLPLGVLLVLLACRARETTPEVQLVTEVHALSPVPADPTLLPSDPLAPRPHSPCHEVERQARELSVNLPRQLDTDTRLTAVTARACELRLEYELSTLITSEVAPDGVQAMRDHTIDQLCSDRGALAVFQQGGSFTQFYYDRTHAPIGHFTVSADDCDDGG
jgi:hypothetical protein